MRDGLVRYCPVCDGYEVRDKRLAVLSAHSHSLSEAQFLTTYSADITYFPARAEAEPQGAAREEARAGGIKLSPFYPDWKIVRHADTLVLKSAGADVVVDAL